MSNTALVVFSLGKNSEKEHNVSCMKEIQEQKQMEEIYIRSCRN